MKIAVIKSGARQFVVHLGGILKVNKLAEKEGDRVIFNNLLGNDKVEAEVVAQGKDRKVRIVKFRNKTGYKRINGHRQMITTLRILSIGTEKFAVKKAPTSKEVKAVDQKIANETV